MEITNYTPFAPFFFESRSPVEVDFGVFIIRGTFSIVPGETLRPHPNQLPIVDADVYFGKAAKSSVRIESDLAPCKPKADISLNAVARAPHGEPAENWLVRMRFGKLEKYLRVTGPRYWQHHTIGGWKLSNPEKCMEVPIRYEAAFGGICENGNEPLVCEYNPIGVGFIDPRHAKRKAPIPAPQIENPFEPIEKVGHQYAPQGLGPIGRAWLPRRKLAGTLDDRWEEERWPELPKDFDYAYYNGAHPDLIYPGYLEGHEQVTLLGLHHHYDLAFRLPSYKIITLLRRRDGSLKIVPMVLDTLYLDLSSDQQEQQRVYLTWRGIFALNQPIRVLEARLQQLDHQTGRRKNA
jgi:hypothetical protein